jgi:hypothetical protein
LFSEFGFSFHFHPIIQNLKLSSHLFLISFSYLLFFIFLSSSIIDFFFLWIWFFFLILNSKLSSHLFFLFHIQSSLLVLGV